jgi:hypothetical protein
MLRFLILCLYTKLGMASMAVMLQLVLVYLTTVLTTKTMNVNVNSAKFWTLARQIFILS